MRLERVLSLSTSFREIDGRKDAICVWSISTIGHTVDEHGNLAMTSKTSIASLDGKRETEHDVLGNIQVLCSSCGCKEQPVTPLTKASLRLGSSLHHVFTRRTLLITSIFFFHFVLDHDRCSSKEPPVNSLIKTFLMLGSSLHRSFSTSST